MVLNDNTDDLVFALNRWSSLKRSMNDGAGLVYVLVAKVAPYWQGKSAAAALGELQNLAKWMQAIALQADRNAYATEQVHTAVLQAQKEMRALAAKPNKAPAKEVIANSLTGDPTPGDLDSRHTEAVRITKQMAWAYETHTPEIRPIPPNPRERIDDGPPTADIGRSVRGGDRSGSPTAPSASPATNGPGVSSSGPTLAGGTAAPPAPPAETPGVVRPPTGSVTPVNALPGGVGVAPNFSGRAAGYPPVGGGQGAGGPRTGAPGQNSNTSGTPKSAGNPSGKPGLPGSGTPGSGHPPSGAGGPNERRGRRGKGTDLVEDRGIFDPNRHHAPPVIGTPRQPASHNGDDDLNVVSEHQPAPVAAVERRDENGYPSQIPDHEIANKDGLRIQFKRDRG